MCGIAGFLLPASGTAERLAEGVRRMADVLQHRGPDGGGVWMDPPCGMAMGHRRLSIIDLSEAGAQPMVSACGRFVLTLNGEIYNHLELRARLQQEAHAPGWRGHSDTETLLAGISAWGLETTLRRCVGMFAIAMWDRQLKRLSLARDRFGEKPLYYGWARGADGHTFVFGSELKALRAFPDFSSVVSRDALRQYFQFLYVPAPWSIYEDARKLEPGHLLEIDASAPRTSWPRTRPYWDASTAIENAVAQPLSDENAALDVLETTLRDAVRLQMISDVPLGAFLSGGVDSSLIASFMQQESGTRVKTFTVGFEEAGFDESSNARAVAEHLGTEHTEMFVTAAEARDVIPMLPEMYDEPFADSSQIPTHLVCRAARRHVTVALSGDGGDELFGGYNRHFWAPLLWKRLSVLPFPLRHRLGRAIQRVPRHGWDSVGSLINRWRPGAAGVSLLGSKAHKLATSLRFSRDPDDMYMSLVSAWPDADLLVLAPDGWTRPVRPWTDAPPVGLKEQGEHMMYRDLRSYLPDDVLCKVDRAAMACSLETRAPFLDHRVAELAWRLPVDMKLRGTTGKWALRQVLYKHVPARLIERPKAGFSIPIGQWLRGPLRSWAEALLQPGRIAADGFLRPEPVRQLWAEHLGGSADRSPELWGVLMFQAWLERTR
jgi:asparagine synthase (glutamine-hydrolysing)